MEPTKTTPQDIKLIVTDIDKTLLNDNLMLSPRNKQALQAAIDAGVQVVLATGKTRAAGAFVTEQLKLNNHGIYMQGLIVYDGEGNVLYEQTLEPSVARQVISYSEDRGFAVIAYSNARILVRRRDAKVVEGIGRYHEPDPEIVGPLQNLLDTVRLNKIIIIGEPRAITALRWQLNAQLGASVRLMQAGIPEMLEILPPGASKGAALRVLLKVLNIPAMQVMAMGDAENDIEMLQAAGLPVAVGNADPRLKAVAKHVVASNDEDGVAEAIERFVIHRKLEDTTLTPDLTLSARGEEAVPDGAPVASPSTVETPAKAEDTP